MPNEDFVYETLLTHGELEQEPNAFFVRFRSKFWENLLHGYTRYTLYVPERFVMYGFSEGREGLILLPMSASPEFTDSQRELRHYRKKIDEGKFFADRPLLLPDTVIDTLEREGRKYNQLRLEVDKARDELKGISNSMQEYLLEDRVR